MVLDLDDVDDFSDFESGAALFLLTALLAVFFQVIAGSKL
jgi:hypothetical protein